ncbi:hypothetical protein BpHYR1_049406 [Brachionus plicatilis]|uniref:Uncharacterized protein n=1 Tax=Brachionus plicatilis TaxID=10195 RepID=A0A3M7SD29_BRAPC|nr:hypothetical protein BpHYR1_049406 [Brachionus plicatilis]
MFFYSSAEYRIIEPKKGDETKPPSSKSARKKPLSKLVLRTTVDEPVMIKLEKKEQMHKVMNQLRKTTLRKVFMNDTKIFDLMF